MTDYDKNFQTFERDDARDKDEDITNGQQVEKCVLDADYIIWNDENLATNDVRNAHLFAKIKDELELMRGKKDVRYPSFHEVHMATAYAQSHSSRCLKRYVGAVIVREDGIPLSLGYNENPTNMLPCISEYKYCFKDYNMDAKLEILKNVHCPECGIENKSLKKPGRV